jgi:tetratricopeptide (TPR) repeat protein
MRMSSVHNKCAAITLAAVAMTMGLAPLSAAQTGAPQGRDTSGTLAPNPLDNQNLGPFGQKMSKATSDRLSAKLKPSNDLEDQARALYHAGNIREAEKVCAEAIRASVRVDDKVWNTSALQLMGEILIRRGRNREAIPYLEQSFNFGSVDVNSHLDLAIAYCRLKSYRKALEHYSDRTVLEPIEDSLPYLAGFLPGTRSQRSLEASALLARGQQDYYHHDSEGTLRYLFEADKLVPGNKLVEFYIQECFTDSFLSVETIRQYAATGRPGNGAVTRAARERLSVVEAWQKRNGGDSKSNDAPP